MRSQDTVARALAIVRTAVELAARRGDLRVDANAFEVPRRHDVEEALVLVVRLAPGRFATLTRFAIERHRHHSDHRDHR